MELYTDPAVVRDVEAQLNAMRWIAWQWGFVWGVLAMMTAVILAQVLLA